jgi:hypothetical protein
LNYK